MGFIFKVFFFRLEMRLNRTNVKLLMGFGFDLEWRIGNWRRRPLLTTTMNHTCCPDNTVARNDGVGGDGAAFYTDAGGGGAPTMHAPEVYICRLARYPALHGAESIRDPYANAPMMLGA